MPPFTGVLHPRHPENQIEPVDRASNSVSVAPKPPSPAVVATARQVGQQLVLFCQADRLFSPSLPPTLDVLVRDDVTITMRKIVRQIVREKEPLFRGMVASVKPKDVEEFQTVFKSIVAQMVEESGSKGLHWGKIVTIYAFGGLLANALVDSAAASEEEDTDPRGRGTKALQRELGDAIGDVVVEVAGEWIQARGGWDDFVHSFGSLNAEESLSRNLFKVVGISATILIGLSLFNWKK